MKFQQPHVRHNTTSVSSLHGLSLHMLRRLVANESNAFLRSKISLVGVIVPKQYIIIKKLEQTCSKFTSRVWYSSSWLADVLVPNREGGETWMGTILSPSAPPVSARARRRTWYVSVGARVSYMSFLVCQDIDLCCWIEIIQNIHVR